MENDFEEALSNIDAFCRVLAKKIAENEEADLEPELIENLLRRKYVVEVYDGCLEWDRPLIDVFEDEKQIKILIQCSRNEDEILFNSGDWGTEILIGKWQRIVLPIEHLDTSKVTVRFRNQLMEITIQKY
ncbi:hypothetical protein KEJ29_06565 [Candidatus Bathyarchaeota archaeon]|nr:hypothetical protein [Candidatus Bathyarchaeota archaeon]